MTGANGSNGSMPPVVAAANSAFPVGVPVAKKQSAKMRAISWLVNRGMKLLNRKVDVGELQRRHNAFREKVVELSVADLQRRWYFRIRDGRVEALERPENVHGGIRITSDCLLALVQQRRAYRNPATGAIEYGPYSPWEAVKYGEVDIWGDAATNDAYLISRVIQEEVYPELRREIEQAQLAALGQSQATQKAVTASNG